MSNKIFEDFVRIGYIQTNLDNAIAWGPENNITLNMKQEAENYVWQEIKKGFHKLYNHHNRPDIIIMPELTVPLGHIRNLKMLAIRINCVVIAGLDYKLKGAEIYNKAILIVPNYWGTMFKSTKASTYYMGKKYQANVERKTIEKYNYKHNSEFNFISDDNMYLINAGKYGKIGFAICADFYDLERFVAYKGRVQHIIIIAYNKDVNSFFALSEAIARLVMCNVIICNTGKFGDSMAFCPYKDKEDYKRQIFRHKGANLFATQVVNVPVRMLVNDQALASSNSGTKHFKCPPEYDYLGEHQKKPLKIEEILV